MDDLLTPSNEVLVRGAEKGSKASLPITATEVDTNTTAVDVNVVAAVPVTGTVTANQGTSPWITDVTDRVGRLLGVLSAGANIIGKVGLDAANLAGIALDATVAAVRDRLPTALVGGRLDVNVGASVLPPGAATDATLATRVADATVTARLGTLGQKTSAGSAPVVIASDQSTLSTDVTDRAARTLGKATITQGGQDAQVLSRSVVGTEAGLITRNISDAPISAFGFPIDVELAILTSQHFTYGIQPSSTKTFASSGSSLSTTQATGGSDLVVSINNANNAFAIARSFRGVHYRAGVGQIIEFTAAFNAGVAGSQQFAGAWSPGAGYFVGLNGTTWGAFTRTAGTVQIETLTVTTAATSAGNVTVTLDGTAVTVAVTNQAGNPSRTAWEIATADYSTAGAAGSWGWDAYALGAVVYFVARRARVNSGSFAFGAGATGSAATMSVVRAGIAENDDFGSPASPGNWTWLDALDGTGPSGLNLDKTKGIIYYFSIGHLGHRGARLFVMNPVTGKPILAADYRYMNRSANALLGNPTLYVAWGIVSNGSTTAMTMQAGSGMGALEGPKQDDEGEVWNLSAAKTVTAGVETHFLSIRNGPVAGFNQTVRASRTQVRASRLVVSVGNAGSNPTIDIKVYRGATLSNLATFAQVDAARLALWAWQDTTTTTNLNSGGNLVLSPRSFINTIAEYDLDVVLEPGELLTVTITSSIGVAVDVDLSGVEIQ